MGEIRIVGPSTLSGVQEHYFLLIYWLATSHGRFYYTYISCNRNIVSSDSTSLIK